MNEIFQNCQYYLNKLMLLFVRMYKKKIYLHDYYMLNKDKMLLKLRDKNGKILLVSF